jgi:acyl carrier protein
MTNDQAAALLDAAIGDVAPDVDLSEVTPDDDLWFSLDLDSMDQLNVMVAIRDRSGIDVPEADYPKLITLADTIAYLAAFPAQG